MSQEYNYKYMAEYSIRQLIIIIIIIIGATGAISNSLRKYVSNIPRKH